jgi:hypothetical protein
MALSNIIPSPTPTPYATKSGQLNVEPNANPPNRVPRTASIQGAWYNCENSTAQEKQIAIRPTRAVDARWSKNPTPQKTISAHRASPPYLVTKAGSGIIRARNANPAAITRPVELADNTLDLDGGEPGEPMFIEPHREACKCNCNAFFRRS